MLVPVYKAVLDRDERMSLDRCLDTLSAHPIVLVAPEGWRPQPGSRIAGATPASIEYFRPEFFRSIEGYNRLMLSPEFYRRFSQFDFILIHQLDALVFSDQLLSWCARRYDYIGAPWLSEHWPEGATPMRRRVLKLLRWHHEVGNGGFSLRSVQGALRVLRLLGPLVRAWQSNEDLFWGLVASRVPGFKVPPADVALRFAFELEPREAFKQLGDVLPFGCHAWRRYDPAFWQQVLANIRAPA